MTEKKIQNKRRKAIFVSDDVFRKFKAAAIKDGRKYSAFLNKLLG